MFPLFLWLVLGALASRLPSAFRRPPFVLVLLALTILVPSTGLAATKWTKLQTHDLIVYSDASSKDVVEYAVGYTAYREAFRRLFDQPLGGPATTVLLYRDLRTLQRALPEPETKGQQSLSYNGDVDGAVLTALAVDGDRTEALKRSYEFETWSALRRGGYDAPLWMAHGAGMVFEALRLKNGVVEIDARNTRYSYSASLPWDRFFAVTQSSPEYAGPDARGDYHRQAWGLMYRVLLGSPNPADAFNALYAKLQHMPASQAVSEVLGVPPKKFDAEISRCVRANPKFSFPFDAAKLRASLQPVPATEIDVHVEISNLHVLAHNPNAAELELAQAQMAAPATGSAKLKEARARSAFREGQDGDGIAYYRDAIALGSDNAIAYLRSAEQRLREVGGFDGTRPGEGGRAAEEAVTEIRRALALQPTNIHAYLLLGRALVLSPQMEPAAVDQLSGAVHRGIAGLQLRYFRSIVHQRLGRDADAVADLRAILAEPLATEPMKDAAQTVLAELILKPVIAEVEAHVEARRFDEAVAAVAAARARDAEPLVLSNLDRLEKWIARARALKQ